MKKTVIASSLAVTLGLAGYGLSSHEAHASETTNVDQAHLVDLAQHNPEQLNAKPVQAGAYEIHFVNNGFQYNFSSNGTNWSWSYEVAGADASNYTQSSLSQAVSSNQQSSNTSVKAVSAPTTSNSSSHNYSTTTTSYSAPSTSLASTGGSVKAQFLAAGGTEAMWNTIVMPESGGNPNASNGQYHGLGQTNQSWGSGSVASQTRGMLDYARSRYGSVGAAMSFRQANGWW
ncbi:transglycosylase [Staphylococcus saccharolyticus]|uniref:aggregation-promoting factor C-terminal-like domain-containing protein n=1 Tax=Staphylococcus saccharolyticus TaxID=33028 RepID=UPI00102DB182|nr:transglycosylase [Staphylococcus saccharolyticus]MBL7573771.1 transglycosylase [Staphylococcus saccharolyticus]MBL7584441.1 transglycosylase [Staphylococcus saccharolyticus]MBL7639303.1 transglycosylase [Staphylococcus saccharolyticus]QRJ68626.1 transglycosylase [Staphylococcus saccharolyticus]TAA91943.1 transglycosylase [Staphylococcus saccharolyticus]